MLTIVIEIKSSKQHNILNVIRRYEKTRQEAVTFCQSGLTARATCPETFNLSVKAVGVTAAAAKPEGRTCIDGYVKEPHLDKVLTRDASICSQLTLG